MKLLLPFLIIVVCVSCGPKNNETVPFSNDEYKIYSLVIDSLYYQKEITGSSKQNTPKYVAHQYVLIDSTIADTTNNISEILFVNGIPAGDLVNNFQTANTKRYPLNGYSKGVKNIKLITLDKYKSYYRNTHQLNDGGMAGFIEFSKEYPHSFGTSVFQVTRAGFTSDNRYAIVGSMHLRGINMGFDYTYLEKVDEKWLIKKIINH